MNDAEDEIRSAEKAGIRYKNRTVTPSETIETLLKLAEWFDDAIYLTGNREKAALIRQAISLLRREGMVWVPEEPTEEMLKAFDEEWFRASWPSYATDMTKDSERITAAYKAMLKTSKEDK